METLTCMHLVCFLERESQMLLEQEQQYSENEDECLVLFYFCCKQEYMEDLGSVMDVLGSL